MKKHDFPIKIGLKVVAGDYRLSVLEEFLIIENDKELKYYNKNCFPINFS